jgi:hypothetical protein
MAHFNSIHMSDGLRWREVVSRTMEHYLSLVKQGYQLFNIYTSTRGTEVPVQDTHIDTYGWERFQKKALFWRTTSEDYSIHQVHPCNSAVGVVGKSFIFSLLILRDEIQCGQRNGKYLLNTLYIKP